MKSKKQRLFRLRTFFWTICCLIVFAAGFFILLMHKPADFVQPEPIKDNQVSKYLTHVLSRDLYNGAQLQEPFELVITEEGINDIIVRLKWPVNLDGINILVPQVAFEPQTIILQGAMQSAQVEFLVTVNGTAFVNKDGLLDLAVSRVKIGAVNVTLLAKTIAQNIYQRELSENPNRNERIEDKIVRAILEGKPFEPVFKIEDNSVRIESVDIVQNKMILQMAPANTRVSES